MSQGRPDLTPYEVAYLAGGPGRVAETATTELLRRGQLRVWPTGLLSRVPAEPLAPLKDAPDTATEAGADGGTDRGAGRNLEQLILGRASAAGGLYLTSMRRRCASWRPVLQIGSVLAAAGLALPRRQRRLALAAAIVLLAACAAAGGAIADGWRAAPTARSPLGAAVAVVVVGLLARACKRTTGNGRRELEDTERLTRQMVAHLLPVTAREAPAAAAAADPDSPALTARDVANVALTGLAAVQDPELRARLAKSAPRGRPSRPAPAEDQDLATARNPS